MVELAPEADGRFAMGFAGDTFNTAWYLRRSLPESWQVDYLTAVGDDTVSTRLSDFIASEGIGTSHVRQIAGGSVCLYVISLSGAERSFTYWRSDSAARRLAEDEAALHRALAGAGLAYLSGITLAILPETDRARLLEALAEARAKGTLLAFDPNLRPRLWPDSDTMRRVVMQAAAGMDIVLPSFDEEALHFGDANPDATAERYQTSGARMVVVKDGAREVVLRKDGQTLRHQPDAATIVVDTTAAGDSFNAGFLAAHLNGRPLQEALAKAATLARRVIGARGALVRGPQ
jgi:2-dehydro-3-deoxygluconokinase